MIWKWWNTHCPTYLKNTKNIVEKVEYKLDDNIYPVIVESIREKLLSNYSQMDEWSNQKEEKNHKRDFTYLNSRADATTVVCMTTTVDIV